MLASVALMAVAVPDSVRVALPLAPALMEAPPASVTATVPWATVSWVVMMPDPESTSVTEIPEIGVLVLEKAAGTALSAGTLLTGPSLLAITVRLADAVPMLLAASPSLAVMVKERDGEADGFSPGLLNCTRRIAAW